MKFSKHHQAYSINFKSPVGLLNFKMDKITRQILSEEVKDNTNWLDLGCGLKPYLSSFSDAQYTGIDVQVSGADLDMKAPDLYFDGNRIPFPDKHFDGILCTQVLEHAVDSELLLNECSRVLKPAGSLIISVPFIYREHEQPYDFRRFTSFGLVKSLERNGFVVPTQIKCLSELETIATIFCCYISNTYGPKGKMMNRLCSFLVIAPTLFLTSRLSRNPQRERDLFCVLFAIGKKASGDGDLKP
jgi:ubiquinone/menaquinone biosynthesis C-methylase UbiE